MKRGSNRAKLFLLASILLAFFHVEGRTLETIEAHPPRYVPRAAERQRVPAEVAASAKPLVLSVTATAYTPSPDETWGDPWLTTSGKRVRPGTTLAVSRDLLARKDIRFGQKARILNYALLRNCAFVIEDKMGAGIAESIDLALLTKKYAFRWGRRYGVKVEILPADAKIQLCTLSKVRAQINKLHRR